MLLICGRPSSRQPQTAAVRHDRDLSSSPLFLAVCSVQIEANLGCIGNFVEDIEPRTDDVEGTVPGHFENWTGYFELV